MRSARPGGNAGEGRLDNPLADDDGQLPGVAHGLAPAELTQEHDRDGAEHDHRDEAGDDELRDRARHG